MATVTNTIKLPGGATPSSVSVEIELVASASGRAAGWVNATDVTVLATYRPTVTSGAWTADLTPNDDIDPAGTVYRVNEYVAGRKYTHYIDVSSGGGTVHDLLTSAPTVGDLLFTSVSGHNAASDAHPGFYRSGGTDVAVADGGTGASTAAAARLSLSAQRSHWLDVRDYGATLDGSTDDTAAINSAITAASTGDTVYIPRGTAMINAGTGNGTGGVQLNKAGIRLLLHGKAKLKAIATSSGSYHVAYVSAADCTIEGGTIEGDGTGHTGSTGEQGHGIVVASGADRCVIDGVAVTLCWGDGIYVDGVSLVDVSIRNSVLTDNRRNNCSIIRAVRPRVVNCVFLNAGLTQFTSPGAGIDWEPNSGGSLTDGLMVGCTTAGNKGPGVAIGTLGTTAEVSVVGWRSSGDAALGASALGQCALYISRNAVARVTGAYIDSPGYYGVVTASTATLAVLTDVEVDAATQFAYNLDGAVEANNCRANNANGASFYVNPTSDGVVLIGCVAKGSGQSISSQAFDIYGDNATLIGCSAKAHGASTSYSFVVRTGATGARLFNCASVAAGTSGHYTDQTSSAVAFPKPGATVPAAVSGSRGSNAALASLLTGLAGLGLITDGTSA